jgi:hypothetical protein
MPVIPVTAESIKWEDRGLGQLGQKVRLYLKNNLSKKGWKHGLRGGAPV